MNAYEAAVLTPILTDPILSKSSYQSLARLLPHVTEKHFKPGETIFAAGSPADYLYLLLEGKARLDSPEVTRVMMRDNDGNLVAMDAALAGVEPKQVTMRRGQLGEEAATDTLNYMSDATAVDAATALMIPRAKLAGLLAENPGLRAEFYQSLMYRFGGRAARRSEDKPSSHPARDNGSWRRICGMLCTILVPASILAFGGDLGLERSIAAFLAVLAATVSMWVFELVDEYVPALFAVLATLLLGVVPSSVVLSGFSSEGFFMAMSILGLGALIVASGLSYRFLLVLLRYLPDRPFWHHAGLMLSGILLTPLVPSTNARIALVGPFMTDMADVLRHKPQSKGMTEMAVGAFGGATILSPVFLTSKSVNFVVLGLLSAQAQAQFSWLGWMLAGAVYGVVALLVYAALAAIMFGRQSAATVSKEQVASQLKLLGPLKNREIAAIVGIIFFSVGVVTSSVHKIQISWLGLAILYGLLLFGFLRKDEFKEKIDWTLLIYLGALGGIMGAFNYLGLDEWLAGYLAPLGGYMRGDFGLFVVVLFAFIFVIRLALPINVTIVLCAAVLMPLGEVNGVHPWVVGFVVLVFGELWFMTYQCSYYSQFRESTGGPNGYDESRFLRFNMIFNALKIAGVFASIPFWAAAGLL